MITGEDLLQMCPILTNAESIVYLDEILYFYRPSVKGSITHKFRPGIYDSLRANSIELLNFLPAWDIEVTSESLAARRLRSISTAAYKVRLCALKDKKTIALPYLERIADDEFFRSAYHAADRGELPIGRRVIIELLYLRRCQLLLFLIRLLNKCK
jgi:hypothetical protein